MPIPAQDQQRLRTAKRQTTVPVINYWPAQVVATAEVAATPTVYPVGALAVTDTSAGWSDIRIGQLVVVRTTAGAFVTQGVVRLAPGENTLYIDGKSRGDPGRAHAVAFGLEAGQLITTYTLQPLWTLFSRIVNGAFYKQFDVAYAGQNANPSPVCNLGPWRQVEAGATGRGRVAFSNALSFAWGGKVKASYQWSRLGPGTTTYVAGSATSADVTLELDQGFHLVRCRLTDDGGAVQDATRLVWVNGPTFPAFSDTATVYPDGPLLQDRQGSQMALRLVGQYDESLILPGAGFLMTERALYDGLPLSAGIGVDAFAGFIGEEGLRLDRKAPSTQFQVLSPWRLFERMPLVSQALIEQAQAVTPADWTQVPYGYGHPDFVAWYLLKLHTTYPELFDFLPLADATPTRKKRWGLQGDTLAEYVSIPGRIVGGNAGCLSDGSLILRRNPNVEDNDFRDALDERMTITDDDIAEAPEVNVSFHNKVGEFKAYAFAYGGDEATPVGAIAPGWGQGQAPGRSLEQMLIVPTGDPAASTRALAGHLLAEANNPYGEIRLRMKRNFDVAEPARMLWYRLDIPIKYNGRNQRLLTRCLVKAVTRTWEKTAGGSWIKRVEWTVVPETYGQPGEDIPSARGQAAFQPVVQPRVLLTITNLVQRYLGGVLFAINNGRLGRTWNGVNWQKIFDPAAGRVNDLVANPYSPFARSGYVAGALDGWAVAVSGTTLAVWYSPNLGADVVTWAKLEEFALAAAPTADTAKIAADPLVEGSVAVQWRELDGTWVAWTDDGGATWSAATQVGDAAAGDAVNAAAPAGLALRNNVLIAAGHDEAAGEHSYTPYRGTLPAPTFAPVPDAPATSMSPNPLLVMDDSGHLYAAVNQAESESTMRAFVISNTESTTESHFGAFRTALLDGAGTTWTKIPGLPFDSGGYNYIQQTAITPDGLGRYVFLYGLGLYYCADVYAVGASFSLVADLEDITGEAISDSAGVRLIIHPANANLLIVVIKSLVCRSENAGATWSQSAPSADFSDWTTAQLLSGSKDDLVSRCWIAAGGSTLSSDETVYLLTAITAFAPDPDLRTTKLVRSSDWFATSEIVVNFGTIAANTSDDSLSYREHVFVPLYRENGLPNLPNSSQEVWLTGHCAVNNSTVLEATELRLFKSVNKGESFTEISIPAFVYLFDGGFEDGSMFFPLAFYRYRSEVALVKKTSSTSGYQLGRTRDGFDTVADVTPSGSFSTPCGVVFDPFEPERYAFYRVNQTTTTDSIFVTDDDGDTWVEHGQAFKANLRRITHVDIGY